MNFEWHTLEDEGQNRLEPSPAEDPKPPPRRWPAVLVVLFLLGLIVWSGYHTLNQRAAAAAAAVDADVLSSAHLVRQAAARSDGELFASLLSGRDTAWANIHQQMLLDGTLLDRPAFGLTWQHVEPSAVTVTLSPNLTEAEVSADLYYTVQQGEGVTTTATLRQTNIYRLGRQRWLLAQPDEAFWGADQTTEFGQIRLTFPERDAAIAHRLAADLAETIQTTCASLQYGIECPAGLQLDILLTHNPYFLNTATPSGSAWLPIGDPLEVRIGLPTPTLIGVPTNEPSYLAFRQGYGAVLADIIITHLHGWPCCNPLYEALVDAQLAELGLRPWPLGPADYAQLLNQPPSLAEIVDQLRTSQMEQHAMYALVEFLRYEDRMIPITAVDRHILGLARQYEWTTLRHLLAIRLLSEAEERAWLQFIYDQSAPTTAAPAEDVQLLCRPEPDLSALYRFDSAANEWTAEIGLREEERRPFVSLIALPAGLLFSPDGRWLAATTVSDDQHTGTLYLHEVATNLTQTYHHNLPATAEGWSADWSADGQWLVLATRRMVVLLNPGENSQQWLVHLYENCGTAVWVAR
jgi:hypothetical protein